MNNKPVWILDIHCSQERISNDSAGANVVKFMSVIYGFTGWVALDDEMVVKLHL